MNPVLKAEAMTDQRGVDVVAINSVIVELEERARNGGIADAYDFESWADKLTAALSNVTASKGDASNG